MFKENLVVCTGLKICQEYTWVDTKTCQATKEPIKENLVYGA